MVTTFRNASDGDSGTVLSKIRKRRGRSNESGRNCQDLFPQRRHSISPIACLSLPVSSNFSCSSLSLSIYLSLSYFSQRFFCMDPKLLLYKQRPPSFSLLALPSLSLLFSVFSGGFLFRLLPHLVFLSMLRHAQESRAAYKQRENSYGCQQFRNAVGRGWLWSRFSHRATQPLKLLF